MSKIKVSRLGCLLASVAVVSLFPALAHAQDARTDTARYDRDEIIVTAQRREQNVRDVPMSIDVIGGEKLVNQGIEDVQRLAESLPSLVVGDQDGTFGGVNLSIRGVGSNTGEPAVGYYVDESSIPTPDRKRVVMGKSGSMRVNHGGGRYV